MDGEYIGTTHGVRTSSRKTIQSGTDSLDGNDIKIFCARVVGTVHHGANRQTERHSEFVARGTTATCPSETVQSKYMEMEGHTAFRHVAALRLKIISWWW